MAKKSTKTDEVFESSGSQMTKEISEDMIKFVRENAKSMTYGEMANALGLKKNQISNILQNYKRKLRSRVGYENYEKRTFINLEGKEAVRPDFSKPVTEHAKKIEAWITQNLCRPVKTSSMSDALSDDVDNVFSEL